MDAQYIGMVPLASTLPVTILTRDGDTPKNSSITVNWRVYGPNGYLGYSGSGAQTTTAITGATNATPIVITSANHGLATGMRVTIAGVGGNTAANGDFTITVVDSNSFSLTGSVGNGAYTSGGTVTVAGLYTFSVVASTANGFLAGSSYTILVSATVSSVAKAYAYTFTVT